MKPRTGALVIAGSVAIPVILAAGWMSRESIGLWWLAGGTKRVVVDDHDGPYSIDDPSAVARAVRVTREFLGSLEKERPQDVLIVGHLSEILFLDAEGAAVFGVRLNHAIDDETGVVEFMGERFICARSAWLGYFRNLTNLRS